MGTTATYPHIEAPEGEPARLARLPRVRVAQIVMDSLAHAWSVDEICRQYPHLRHAEVHSAFAYYFDHREKLDEEIGREIRQAEALQNDRSESSLRLRLRAQSRGS